MTFNLADIIQSSLKLAWKHKMLWVFAILLSGTMSFNSGPSGRVGENSNDSQNIQEYTPPQVQETSYITDSAIPETTLEPQQLTSGGLKDVSQNVLGLTGRSASSVLNTLTQVVYARPILSILILLALLIGVASITTIALMVRSFLQGALLCGLDDALGEQPYTLSSLGRYGRTHLTEFFKYNIVLSMITLLTLIILLIAPGVLIFVDYAFSLIFLFTIPALTIILLLLSIQSIFAQRLIAVSGYKTVQAIKVGIKMVFSGFLKIVLLGVTNCFVTSIFGIILLITLGFFILLLFVPFALIDFKAIELLSAVLLVSFTIPFGLVVLLILTAYTGYIKTYTYFTWSQLFKYLHTKLELLPSTQLADTDLVPQAGTGFENDIENSKEQHVTK